MAGQRRNASSTTNSSENTPDRMSNDQSVVQPKARLTDQQKRENHINSETKRRKAIQEVLAQIANLVPGMEGQLNPNEKDVILKYVEVAEEAKQERKALIEQIERRGGTVEDKDKGHDDVEKWLDDDD